MEEEIKGAPRHVRSSPSAEAAPRPAWSAYQEDVATFFRELGLEAQTNMRVEGARGVHDVDVLVVFRSAGITVTWVVECKQWSRPIPKERVLILAGVIADIGADRGLILAECGYQAGAIRASANTNVTLTSLGDLTAHTSDERNQIQIAAVRSRIEALHVLTGRCWRWAPPSTPSGGIKIGEMMEVAGHTFELNALVLPRMLANSYPIFVGGMGSPTQVSNAVERVEVLARRLDALEQDAEVLLSAARSAAARVTTLVDDLGGGAIDLITAGRALPEDLHTTDSVDQAILFVHAMRRIGSAADSLKTGAPDGVRAEVGQLMRHVIDETYEVSETSRPNWDVEEVVLQDYIARVREALEQTRISNV